MSAIQVHRRLVAGLARWFAWQQPESGGVEVIETHISTVLLAGCYAYKIKKPVDLGFLDFSTLDRRRFCCLEELRLNSRLAADLYLDVVAITGNPDQPEIGGIGTVIEYALKMRRFPDGSLLSQQPERLDEALADRLAREIADFHAAIATPGIVPFYGAPEQVLQPMLQNFTQIRSLSGTAYDAVLAPLQQWTLATYRQLEPRISERRREGYVRECHGDLHLGNIALDGDRPILFDGIEFNPELRWIDTISELAFLLMDIEEKRRSPLGWRLLNSYLEISGDYRGLELLRFYQLYRAMVRAKVEAIRLHQTGVTAAEREQLQAEFFTYLENARSYTGEGRAALLITHGFSGSGKSTLSERLSMELPAVRIRSDVERKRLAGLAADADSFSAPAAGIYTPEFSARTYQQLLMLAQVVLKAGYGVIVDAAFLKCRERDPFTMLALELGLPFLILDFQVSDEVLRNRVRARRLHGSDPSEADEKVLAHQFRSAERLTASERKRSVAVNGQELQLSALAKQIQAYCGG
ncbi:MAG: AAA family ATPase [Chromatiaceae bacterium]|nr:AAA family ATPase [Chromatiaceae bacterium]